MGSERHRCDVHGDRACYLGGCRCSECREGNAIYQRAYRRGEKG